MRDTSQSLARFLKFTSSLSNRVLHMLILGWTIGSMVFPLHMVHAQDAVVTGGVGDIVEPVTGKSDSDLDGSSILPLPEALFREAYEDLKAEKSVINLSISEDARELGNLDQSVEIMERNGHWTAYDLNDVNIEIPSVAVGPEVIERNPIVEAHARGVAISAEGIDARQVIHFKDGETLHSHSSDSDYIFFVTTKGRVFALAIAGLRTAIFATQTPVTLIGQLPAEKISQEFSIRIIRDRSGDLKNTHEHQRARDDKRQAWGEYQTLMATPETIEIMEDNYSKTVYIPLSEELKTSAPYLASGDLAVVGDGEIVAIVPRVAVQERVAATSAVLLKSVEMVTSNWSDFSQPAHNNESHPLSSAAAAVSAQVNSAGTVDENPLLRYILESMQGGDVASLVRDGLTERLSMVDPTYLREAIAAAVTGLNGDSSRRRFLPSTWEADSARLADTIEKAKAADASRSRRENGIWRSTIASYRAGVGFFDRKNLAKVYGFLRKGAVCAAACAVAAGIDQAEFHGVGQAMFTQFLAGTYTWVVDQFPVLSPKLMVQFDPNEAPVNYLALQAKSMAFAAAIPLAIFGVLKIFSKFTHYTASELFTNGGIRTNGYMYWALQYPLGFMANLTKQTVALKSWAKGVFSGPIFSKKQAANAAQKVRNRAFRERVATLVAIAAAAHSSGVEPGEILNRLAEQSSPGSVLAPEQLAKNKDELMSRLQELSMTVRHGLDELTEEEITEAVNGNEVLILTVFKAAIAEADKLINDTQHISRLQRWAIYLKKVVPLKILARFGKTSDDKVESLISGRADPTITSMTIAGLATDYGLTVGTADLIGANADVSHPDLLRAQPNMLSGWTHRYGQVEIAGDLWGHFMGSASTYLQWGSDHNTVGRQHTSNFQADMQEVQNQKYLPFLKELAFYFGRMLDVRNFDVLEETAQWFNRTRYALFRLTLANSLIPRFLFLKQSGSDLVLGSLASMYTGIFRYAWSWFLYFNLNPKHEQRFKARYGLFSRAQEELAQAIDLGDRERIANASAMLLNVYKIGDFKYDRIPERGPGEPIEDYASNRLIPFSRENPAMAKSSRSSMQYIILTMIGVVTTYLATYLAVDTSSDTASAAGTTLNMFNVVLPDFENLYQTAISADSTLVEKIPAMVSDILTPFNLFSGIPKSVDANGVPYQDGVVALAAKAGVIFWTALTLKAGFNASWDAAMVKIPWFRNSLEAKGKLDAVVSRYAGAVARLKSLNPFTKAAKLVKKTYRAVVGPEKPYFPKISAERLSSCGVVFGMNTNEASE